MSQNIELKARVESMEHAIGIAQKLTGAEAERISQKDTYFRVKHGRLKLRQSPQLGDELIFYHRDSSSSARGCRYFRQKTSAAEAVASQLERICGVDTVVSKERRLFWYQRVRIHLDEIESLGSFLEFEAVLGESFEADRWSEQKGFEAVDKLRSDFLIDESHLIGKSYRELMLESRSA